MTHPDFGFLMLVAKGVAAARCVDASAAGFRASDDNLIVGMLSALLILVEQSQLSASIRFLCERRPST